MMTQEKQKKKNWFLKNAEKMNTKCKGKTEKKYQGKNCIWNPKMKFQKHQIKIQIKKSRQNFKTTS